MSNSLVITIYALLATVVINATLYHGANMYISAVIVAALVYRAYRRIKP